MEKKGEILNQLAIISDLLEGADIICESKSIIFMMGNDEYKKMANKIEKKTKTKIDLSNTKFSIKIGDVDFVFNKNNV